MLKTSISVPVIMIIVNLLAGIVQVALGYYAFAAFNLGTAVFMITVMRD